MTLTNKIFFAMAAGIAFGSIANILPESNYDIWLEKIVFLGLFDIVGSIFVASLKLLVVPMVFVSLTCGTASLSGHGNMGAMAAKTVGLYLMTTAIAITIALSIALIMEPGSGDQFNSQLTTDASYVAKDAPPLKNVLINIIPSNPIKAMAEGNMLQVIVFALLFGIAISRSGEFGVKIAKSFESLNEVIMEMVMILMRLAPYGIFCLLAKIFYATGFDLIQQLFAYFITVVMALLFWRYYLYRHIKIIYRAKPYKVFKAYATSNDVWLFYRFKQCNYARYLRDGRRKNGRQEFCCFIYCSFRCNY